MLSVQNKTLPNNTTRTQYEYRIGVFTIIRSVCKCFFFLLCFSSVIQLRWQISYICTLPPSNKNLAQ